MAQVKGVYNEDDTVTLANGKEVVLKHGAAQALNTADEAVAEGITLPSDAVIAVYGTDGSRLNVKPEDFDACESAYFP